MNSQNQNNNVRAVQMTSVMAHTHLQDIGTAKLQNDLVLKLMQSEPDADWTIAVITAKFFAMRHRSLNQANAVNRCLDELKKQGLVTFSKYITRKCPITGREVMIRKLVIDPQTKIEATV